MLEEYLFQSEYQVPDRDYIQYCSIDPAKKNFAILVERRYSDGTISTYIYDKWDLSGLCPLDYLTKILFEYKNIFNSCDYIIVEKQLKVNKVASPPAKHAISFFLFYLRDNERRTRVFEIDPRAKSKILKNGPKDNRDIKKLSIDYCIELLNKRNDVVKLQILSYHKKKDDLADVVTQLEAALLIGFPERRWNNRLYKHNYLHGPPDQQVTTN